MNYTLTETGVVFLDRDLSALGKRVLDDCCSFLEDRGLTYLATPSLMPTATFTDQEVIAVPEQVVGFDGDTGLTGSAEQGILERFRGQEVESQVIYARNQCFRAEARYEGLVRCREFEKVEQFSFSYEDEQEDRFDQLLQNGLDFVEQLGLIPRVTDRTLLDPGYHLKKYDIEVWTGTYGWLETHSCTLFGREQSRRFGVTGADCTVSNTGVAAPRILVPLMEKAGIDPWPKKSQIFAASW